MAYPAYRSHAVTAYASTGTSVAPAKPTGLTDNDLLIMEVGLFADTNPLSAAETITWPSGFTQLQSSYNNTVGAKEIQHAYAYKFVASAAGEGATYTASWTNSRGNQSRIFAFSGAYSVTPIDDSGDTATSGSATGLTSPALTAEACDSLYLALNQTWDGGTVTWAANFTSIVNGASLTAGTRRRPGTGSHGTFSHTNSISTNRIASGVLIASQASSATPMTITLLVEQGSDDAEESTGGVVTINGATTTNDLDSGGTERVGIRFSGATIPPAATIDTAVMVVEPTGTAADEPQVTIHGEASDNAATFTTGAANISGRATTTASADWSSADLSATGTSRHNTSSVATIVQEIVNRGGWASGNAMAMLIRSQALSSTRDLSIKCYETSQADAAELVITFTPAAVGGTIRRYSLTLSGVG